MVNFKELLGNDNQLQNLLLDTVEEGEVYRLCLTKEEGIIPKNKGDEGRKKFFVVVGKDQEGNAIGFVLINSEINKHLPESRRKLHYLLKASEYEFLGDQDRFVDCSDFKRISKERFAELFSMDKMKGKINKNDLVEIKKAICSYENVSILFLLSSDIRILCYHRNYVNALMYKDGEYHLFFQYNPSNSTLCNIYYSL